MDRKTIGGTIAAGMTGMILVLALLGAYELAHGQSLEREYTRRSELPEVSPKQRRAALEFLRTTGHGGIPDECTVGVDFGANPRDPRAYFMDCPVRIRIDQE